METQLPALGPRATQAGRQRIWPEAPGQGSLDGEGVNLGIRAGTVSKKTWTLGVAWVSFTPHHLASLQMAASASRSQAAALPGLPCLACPWRLVLPALGAALCPGARGSRQVRTSNKEAVAGFLPSGKREGLEGVAPSSTSRTPDPPGTRACPQKVGEAERGGQLTPTHP